MAARAVADPNKFVSIPDFDNDAPVVKAFLRRKESESVEVEFTVQTEETVGDGVMTVRPGEHFEGVPYSELRNLSVGDRVDV